MFSNPPSVLTLTPTAFGTSVGSKTLTLKQAVIVSAR